MNIEQAFHYAEYLSHTYCYPEFINGELSEKEQKRSNQSPSKLQRPSEGQTPMSSLPQSKHHEGQRSTRVPKL